MSFLDSLDESWVDDAERLFFDRVAESKDDDGDGLLPIPEELIEAIRQYDPAYVTRPHLDYLARRLTKALRDVENGIDRKIAISMPSRLGKTETGSKGLATYVLRQHPTWPVVLISSESTLATDWSADIRDLAEDQPGLGIVIRRTSKAKARWQTVQKGSVTARGIGGNITGRGAKVLIIDDPLKDFAEAHSPAAREKVWDWFIGTALMRLEPPSLVLVTMTRWHENDLIGRLLSTEYPGDPADWEVIRLPGIADHEVGTDELGRQPGEPLYSPLLEETSNQAVTRWLKLRESVGTYAFQAMVQQDPMPSKGVVYDTNWFRFWTTDASRETPDGKIVYFDPFAHIKDSNAFWLESWDMAFKAKSDSDYVVGQRWLRLDANRYLTDQVRARLTFTQTVARVLEWAEDARFADQVRYRLVEDKANGTAVIDMLRDTVPRLKPDNPTESKLARAHSVTPDYETGNVLLPHPAMPGYEWVQDFIDEHRAFPNGNHDDQVDCGNQALRKLRSGGPAAVVTTAGMGRKVIGA